VTTPVSETPQTPRKSLPSRQAASTAATSFDGTLRLEQADTLMRQTPHFAKWDRLRQNNDTKTEQVALTILQREELLRIHRSGRPIDWPSFDSLTAQLARSGFPLPNSNAILARVNNAVSSSTTTPTDAKASPSVLSDDTLLILTANCPAVPQSRDIMAYEDGQTIWLPLGEMARTLDFAIKVDPKRKTASGWFIAEDRMLDIDFTHKTLRVGKSALPWPEGKIAATKDDIYVASDVLSQWFPVDFTVASGDMALNITPREQLPIQAQAERERQRSRLSGKEDRNVKYPVQETDYELLSLPVLDVALQTGFEGSNHSKSNLQLNHSITGEGDLAHMSAKLFLSGDEEEPLENARFTLEKVDRKAALLGPMKASKIAIGDISPARLPILGSPQVERGVTITNGDIERSRDFDSTRFEGYTQPGWDVELYQNGNLLNSVRVGGDGHYLIENVPVYFGNNGFQLLALGPQGQRRMIESRNINVGSGMLKKGEVNYSVSASQQRKTIIGLEQTSDDEERQGHPRLSGQVAYGLNDHLTMSSGFSSIEFGNTLHNYTQAGISGSLSSLYTELNAVQDSAGGSGYSMQEQAAIGPFNIRAKQEYFSDFIDENYSDKILEQRSSYGIYGRIAESILPTLSYTLSRDSTVYSDDETGKYSARLSGRLSKVYLSNQLNWNDTAAEDKPDMDGQFQASGSVGRVRVNAGLEYDLGEDDNITRYKLSGLWPITRGLSTRADFIQDVGDQEKSTARLNLNFDTGKYILTPSMSYSSNGEFGVFLGLSFSLGQDPVNDDMIIKSEKRAGTGSATALVYHDTNNNQVFDQNDRPLPEVTVIASQAGKKAKTDENGVAQFTSMRTSSPTDVTIDPDSLEDPSWQPAVAGKAISTRAGASSRVELPVVSAGEIDGTVSRQDQNGHKHPLAHAQLELKNQDGATIQRVVSEHDGFYLFEKVPPGTYILHLHSDEPTLQPGAAAWQGQVVVGNDGTIVRGNDITLPPTGRRPQAVHLTQPVSQSKNSSQTVAPEISPLPSASNAFTLHPLEIAHTLTSASQLSAVMADKNTPPRRSQMEEPMGHSAIPSTSRYYGVQVASYKTLNSAKAGMTILGNQLAGLMGNHRFTVARVDLGGEKGVFYRVILGNFDTKDEAEQLEKQVTKSIKQARALAVDVESTIIEQMPTHGKNRPTPLSASIVAGRYAAMQQTR